MKVSKTYNPSENEKKWYEYWLKKKYFASQPDDKEPYTIVIPPPNVTGILHMGHMLNNTIQDILVRKARMQGYNACWVPGIDHASIATEAKVVKSLSDKGIRKEDLSRKEFLEHAWKWKEHHGGIILEQLKKLGASCDWERTKFTMDHDLSESVKKVFIDLHEKGLIYKGVRMVNWDSEAQTTVSDEEVLYKEIDSKLFHISYQIENENEKIIVATTRPETILGDTAICVNPKDKRYSNLVGKDVYVPLIKRKIPIISDEYVDMEFGTGALKITPAHDINDYEIGYRHKLDTIDILNNDGTLNEKAKLFVGIDRFKARELIVEELKQGNHLVRIENHKNKVGFSERTNSIIEPKLSMQWFLKMDKISKPALDNVLNGNIEFYPKKFINTYKHWMSNIKDWCLSRQLWWGHRIPVYYYDGNNYVVAKSDKDAYKKIKEINPNIKFEEIHQDEDVLDTWFSSWIWPISVFDGINKPENAEFKYYYPTNDLVTAPEILFFWVARMIISGYEYCDQHPFKNVYLTGIVRDKIGRKMSKSLGNSPDPIELIEKYSADGVRVGMLLCSPAGNDLPFDESLCEQGRNFANKIWNSYRLIKSLNIDQKINQKPHCKSAILWFENRINLKLEQINKSFNQFRISESLMITYKLIWDDFCSWYLEIIKPSFGEDLDQETYEKTKYFLQTLLKIIHPFMPFISEEIWNDLKDNNENDLIVSNWPELKEFDLNLDLNFSISMNIITSIRNIRSKNNISSSDKLDLFSAKKISFDEEVVKKLSNLKSINFSNTKDEKCFSFICDSNEFYIPYDGNIDIESEKIKILKELDHLNKFLISIKKKLDNNKFVSNAPAKVIDMERKKENDTMEKIKILENRLKNI
ncbi:valine--tRNA ligase [Bacteroidota bacterium]|nr:valine--tRNA ligase [Bacteroidota bacterium]MDC3230213.1 valine--tRNA ligase [Bacteroidota bacterium]